MPMCAAFGCSESGGHLFPRDQELKLQWIAALKREKYNPTQTAIVCHRHFKETDYETTSYDSGHMLKNRRLKKQAVSSVFSWKKNLNSCLVEKRADRAQKRQAVKSNKEPTKKRRRIQNLKDAEASTLERDVWPHEEYMDIAINEFSDVTLLPDNPDIGSEVEISAGVNNDILLAELDRVEECESTFTPVSENVSSKPPTLIDRVKKKSLYILYYTGLESYEKFLLVLHSLGPAAYELNYRYNTIENISVEDQFLMSLIKLRRTEPDLGLAVMFDVSRKSVQNIVTWLNFMYCEWSEVNLWPSKNLVHYYMPNGFKQQYPSTRVIVDGTENPVAAPSKPLYSKQLLVPTKIGQL